MREDCVRRVYNEYLISLGLPLGRDVEKEVGRVVSAKASYGILFCLDGAGKVTRYFFRSADCENNRLPVPSSLVSFVPTKKARGRYARATDVSTIAVPK